MNLQQVPANLTIISIFQLISIQQNYRTVNFLTNGSSSDTFNEIIKNASNSLKPIQLINFEEWNVTLNRNSSGEPVLNLLIVNDLQDIQKRLKERYLYGTTLIWPTNPIEDDLNDTTISSLKVSSKVMLLTDSDLYAFNNFVDARLSRLILSNFSLPSMKKFLKTFFSIESVRGSKLTIFSEFSAPRSDLTRIDDNYCFIGPDGIIAEVFLKTLNIQPTFSSSVEDKHSSYQDWLNSSLLSLKLRYQHFYSATLTNNVVTIFDQKAFDLQLSSFPVKKMSTEVLFPHGIDCLTAIVPQQHQSHDFIRRLVTNANTMCICLTLLLFTLWRLLLQKHIWNNVFLIFFYTIGVFLNQSRIRNDNRMKVAWDINLRAFSVLATTTLSAIVFKYLISAEHNDINTIDDLLESNLTIYAPNYLKTHEIWQYVRPSLRSIVNFKPADDIESYLVEEHKFNFAYLYFESKAGYIAMMANAKVPIGSGQWVRLMKERIHCTPLSYRTAKNSPLTLNVNLFILKMLENGVYYKQMEWIENLNAAVFATRRNKPPKRNNIVLTVKMSVDVFYMYLTGIGMSIICFIVEWVFSNTLLFRSTRFHFRKVLFPKK